MKHTMQHRRKENPFCPRGILAEKDWHAYCFSPGSGGPKDSGIYEMEKTTCFHWKES